MYDVEGLEKEWKRYKAKRRIPWVVSAVLIVLVILLIVFREDFLAILPIYSKDDNRSMKQEVVIAQKSKALKPYVPTMMPKSESNQSTQEIVPEKSSEEINESAEKKEAPSMSIEVSELEAEPVKEHKRKYLKIEVTDRYPAKKPSKKKKKRTIESIEENFSKSRRYQDSLYLARAYYKKGNYTQAQKWALVTNDINSKLEESWLIFAKAKVKLGKLSEAQQVLTAYIAKTHSSKAKALLRKIKKGKL